MAVYSNKFIIEKNGIIRIIFIDKRSPIADGLPMASVTVAEAVVTEENARALAETILKVTGK